MRQAGQDIPAMGKNYRDLPQEKWSVSQRIRHAKREEFEELVTLGGYRVCVDMAFEDLMVDKARASLVQQVRSDVVFVSERTVLMMTNVSQRRPRRCGVFSGKVLF